MFEKVKVTRRQGKNNARVTMKFNQRGGRTLTKEEEQRIKEAREKAAATPAAGAQSAPAGITVAAEKPIKEVWQKLPINLELELPDHLKFVLEFKQPSSDNAQMLQYYIKLIERQDEIFAHALKAVYKELNINETDDEETIINKLKPKLEEATSAIKSYIGGVANLIYFNDGLENEKNPTFELFINNQTKIKIILDSNKTPAIELLLNPEQVQNQFIKYLASVCIIQKKYPDILNKAKSDINVMTTRALRYEATSEAYAYALTSNRLRDGFFALQTLSRFEKILGHGQDDTKRGFWWKFINKCIYDNSTYKVKDKDNGEDKDKTQERFSYLTAVVFKIYEKIVEGMILKEAVIKKLLEDHTVDGKLPIATTYNAIHLPGLYKSKQSGIRNFDETQINEKIFGDVTLKSLLGIMSIGEIQFILHLCYTITKNEANVISEAQAMTPETAVPTA